jgi:lipid II:glycine glycyltransferase (peptidoglycan interpeptide bridge formation enzyme)
VIRVPRRAHLLDLRSGFDAVWGRAFTSDCRRYVRNALRAGLTVERGHGRVELDAFAELHERSVERWAKRAGPAPVQLWVRGRAERRAKFDAAAAALGDGMAVWVARQSGRPVAAIMVLSQGETASYWRGAMDEEQAGRTRANYLLHQLAIEDACRAGRRTYHMGDTGMSASLAQFKTRFGAVPVDYSEVRLERLPFTATSSAFHSAAEVLLRVRADHGAPAPAGRASSGDADPETKGA